MLMRLPKQLIPLIGITNDQRSLLAVMEDYFTSNEDPDEDQLLGNEAGKLW